MAEDKREAILARLADIYAALAEDVEGSSYRNKAHIPEAKLPAFVLLDADEVADDSAYGKGRPPFGPVIMLLQPESYIVLQENAQDVGTELSAFRSKLVKAVCTDQTLVDLCHAGDIRYDGFTTGLALGRSMTGESQVNFTFRYVLKPREL